MRKKLLSLLFGLALLISSENVIAHKGHHHEATAESKTSKINEDKAISERINEAYKRDVKAIFQKSCFDCHSQSPNYPWYYSVPLVHGLITSDISEAKEHLDFTGDFPFQGHGSAKEDLQAIGDSIADKSMPPFRYLAMHPSKRLSSSERLTVQKWVTESQTLLVK